MRQFFAVDGPGQVFIMVYLNLCNQEEYKENSVVTT